jgi:hypothetical protein
MLNFHVVRVDFLPLDHPLKLSNKFYQLLILLLLTQTLSINEFQFIIQSPHDLIIPFDFFLVNEMITLQVT